MIDYALISPTLFRSVIDFNVLTFDPILSDIHKPICLHLCTNIVNNSNLTEDADIDSELNSSDIVITHVGESKDSHIVITREGETVVKPRWCGDRIPVFKDSLNELLISLGAVNPQNTNIVTDNKIVNDCNNIIKSAADKSGMFVYINPHKKSVQTSIIQLVKGILIVIVI